MLSVADAAERLARHVAGFGTQRMPVGDAAGQVLRQPVLAERDQPPFDRVMMDGIAIAHASWAAGRRQFAVQHVQAAGEAALALTDPAGCVEIMTGAALPPGCDTVIPVERTSTRDDGTLTVDDSNVEAGQFVHLAGSDHRRGARLLDTGIRLGGPEMAVLASSGLADVEIARQPDIAVLAIGDELVGPGEPVTPYTIRRSNDAGIAGLLHDAGFSRVVCDHLPDDPAIIAAGLAAHLASRDALVLSGGVSMGKFDYIPGVLDELGVELVFHRVAQRPGKPMWFGVSRDGKPVFALPGNPVSTLVCTRRHVIPALSHALGAAPEPAVRVRLAAPLRCPWPLTTFVPVRVSYNDRGVALAEPVPTNTSGDFAALAGTDGFVEIDAGVDAAAAGDVLAFFPWQAGGPCRS